jgi:hypothetical protein
VVKLPWAALVALLAESVGERLVVGDHEVPYFQHVQEMLHSLVVNQHLSVIMVIFLLRRAIFLEKNAKCCQAS